jgi:proteasome lid subunit RPN8/RPN11
MIPMEALKLSHLLYNQMLTYAREALPMEAVGLLGGHSNGRVLSVLPLTNIAAPEEFLADPFDQFKAERQLSRNGLSLLAIYHSHPGGGTQLSASDCSLTFNRSLLQLVIALARPGQVDDVRAYYLIDGTPLLVDILLD